MPRRNLTKWVNVRGKMEWRSETGGYGELQIVRSERTRPFQYLLMTRPFTGNGIVLSGHGSLAAAKKAGEVFARKLQAHKGNPMPKRKATAAQLRNLAKGRKKLAAMRRAGTVSTRRRRPTRRNPCVPAAHRNPCVPAAHRNPDISDEAYELILYAENTEALYNQQQSIVKNLIRKINRGVYDHSKAPTLWKYWMDSAAKGYTREHGTGRGYGIFTAPIRREAAGYMAQQEYDSIMAGDYEDLMALKKNPAFGNFMTARNVLKSGRTTNPKRRSYSGGIPPGTKGRAFHNVIASIDPKSGRTVWWGAFGWGPDKKAVTFSDIKNAKYVANKMKRPVVIAKEFTSAHELGKVLRGET